MVENMINERKRYETAICFARMYGVRETLEPVLTGLSCGGNKLTTLNVSKTRLWYTCIVMTT